MKKQKIELNLEKIILNLQELIELQKTEIVLLKEEHESSSTEAHALIHQLDFLFLFLEKNNLSEEFYEFINEELVRVKSDSLERSILSDLLKNWREMNDKESDT